MNKIAGVNLGGWLVLEKWMTPALFASTDAEDEYYLPRLLREDIYRERIRLHRHSFITSRDLKIIRAWGFNSIRVPVPYFIFGDVEPFIGCVDELDWLMSEAKLYDLSVMIDLHTVPLSQNGFDNGGISGVCKWSQSTEAVAFTFSVLERLARRYGNHGALLGIELLNEPITQKMWQVMDVEKRYRIRDKKLGEGSAPNSIEFIQDFYKEAIKRVRPFLAEDKLIFIHDAFEIDLWDKFYDKRKYPNLILDTHQYLMMLEANESFESIDELLLAIKHNFYEPIASVASHIDVVCGEWTLFNSLCVGRNTRAGLADFSSVQNLNRSSMPETEQTRLYQSVCKAQLQAFNQSLGHYYWNYKLLLDEVTNPGFTGWESWDLGVSLSRTWFVQA